MKSILITNAAIVNEGQIRSGDVLIKRGKIEAVGGDLGGRPVDLVIEGAGKTLLPGLIDDQVHFREPGYTHKGDIRTESRAAVAGGTTSFMEMPNTNPQTVTNSLLEAKFQRAAETSLANFSFYLGATNDNVEEIKRVDPVNVCGVKVFMGASTGNMLVDNPETLETIFASSPLLIATHCEDTATIKANEQLFRAQYGEEVPVRFHPAIRSEEACYRSSSLAVALARKHGARLHVLHISTARELALFPPGPIAGKHITAEACVHHLFFAEEDYQTQGAGIKCNPAIKSAADRAALQQAVREDRIDVIATDHAPHTREEKAQLYFQAPSGLPLIQHALLSLLEHYHRGIFSLELIAEKTSHAVAELYQIDGRGYIREGYWADLVLVDLNRPFTVGPENVLSKCGWSPFDGYTFRSTVDATIVSGHLAYHNGRLNPVENGKRLRFLR
ncbi:MAG: dihydroorotase [Calditrichaeota bacterium]|nr:dihydroorotase [Calditrichota bacterium]MCB9088052.1 dihydroorotase [Calditrichia bacterium]